MVQQSIKEPIIEGKADQSGDINNPLPIHCLRSSMDTG